LADNGVVAAEGRPTSWTSLGLLAALVLRDAIDDCRGGRKGRESDRTASFPASAWPATGRSRPTCPAWRSAALQGRGHGRQEI